MPARATLFLFLAVLPVSFAAARDCPVVGEVVQWQADYCLFETGTDDIIAAGPCMEREATKRFRSECTAKLHYKALLCALSIRAGARQGTQEACVDDAGFMGPTVRNGGI